MNDEDISDIIELGLEPILRNPEIVDECVIDRQALALTRENWTGMVEDILNHELPEAWVTVLVDRLMMAYLLGCRRSGALPESVWSQPIPYLIATIKREDAWQAPRTSWAATLDVILRDWPDHGVVATIVDMLVEAYVTGCQKRPRGRPRRK